MRKLSVISVCSMVLLLCIGHVAEAKRPKHAEREIIVKFKQSPALVETDQEGVIITGMPSIDSLSKKHKIKSMKKLMKRHRKAIDTMGKESGRKPPKNKKDKISEEKKHKKIKDAYNKHGLDKIYIIRINDERELEKLMRNLRNDPNVEYAEPNYQVQIDAMPNDPGFSELWGLHNVGQTGGIGNVDIDAPLAWSIETGSKDVIIAVIDSGVDYTHEDLAENIWINENEIPDNGIDDDENGFIDDIRGWDFYNNDNDPMDDNSHGTHCSGTIGAVGNNNTGIVGVNWNVSIMPLKFLDASGSGWTSDAIECIEYATLMNADIMSSSWGSEGFSQALKDVIQAASDAGILFVAAAGNGYADTDVSPYYPSCYDVPNVVSVAALDHNNQKPGFSNYGLESVDLGAPGVDIYSTVPGNRYAENSGTSMACPHVSGVAGLIKACFPEAASDQIKARLLASVFPCEALEGITVTGGRVNAYSCLEDDTVPPFAVNDLFASNPTVNSVTLTWTATGDDGIDGTAEMYDVRYATFSIDKFNWDRASEAQGEPQPQSSGMLESFTVTDLTYNTAYFFAIMVMDNAGNISEISNVTSETTSFPILSFYDDMESGINGWTASGLWHQETKRSHSPQTSWAYNTGAPDYDYNTGYNWGLLISPIFSLEQSSSAILIFTYWYNTENTGTYYDNRKIKILVDGDYAKSVQLSGDDMNTWHTYSLDLSEYAGESHVQIEFLFDTFDALYNTYEGWYIDDVKIIVDNVGPNITPFADAGGPYIGTVNMPVTLDGSNSVDPESSELTYLWDYGDGGTGEGKISSHTYTSTGTYHVTLVVNDGGLDSLPNVSTATIVLNQPPVADVGGPYQGEQYIYLDFDGSGSSDPEGSELSYTWDFGDGVVESATNPVIGHIYESTGAFTVILQVYDGELYSDTSTTIADILPPNQPPVADAGGPYTAKEGQYVFMYGGNSYDPEGNTLVDYTWDFGDGQISHAISSHTYHTYLSSGIFTVSLKVSDGKVYSELSYTTATITENLLPIAIAGGPYSTVEGNGITFDAGQSYDPEGLPILYFWNFGDGTVIGDLPESNYFHTYEQPGVYTVILRVHDGYKFSESSIVTATVVADAPPIADAGGPYEGFVDQYITIDGSNSYDPEGANLYYYWEFGDGFSTQGYLPVEAHSYKNAGTVTIALQVSDGRSLSEVSYSTATIMSDPNTPPIADAGGPYQSRVNKFMQLDGSGSYDPDDDSIVQYRWNLGDSGNWYFGETPWVIYDSTGVYNITLIVNDGKADSLASISTATIVGNSPPVADAGGPYQGIQNQGILFDGTNSYDPDGDTLHSYYFKWNFGDSASWYLNATPYHIYNQPGEYTVTLIVTDGDDDSLPSVTTAMVIANTPPIADSGGPYEGIEGLEVEFDGSNSYDPDSSALLRYFWKFGDGSSASAVGLAKPKHIYNEPGVYSVTLIANDGYLDSVPSISTAAIITTNQPPLANAGGPYSGLEYSPVQFDGTLSIDPDGDELIYSWSFGDGTTGSGATPSHTYQDPGVYNVSLTVSDGEFTSEISSTTATIQNVNEQPTANAGGPYSGLEYSPVQFNGTLSSDPDGDALTYTWDFGDGTIGSGAISTHTYQNPGVYTVSLVVSDGELTSEESQTTATIENVNEAPIANAGGPYAGLEYSPVQFNGTLSSDPDGDALTYTWDFGDGTSGIGATPNHAYGNAGTYTVTLVVSDGEMNSAPSITTVNVAQLTEGHVLSKNADYSTDDRVYKRQDTIHIRVVTYGVDYNKIKRAEVEFKTTREKITFTNQRNGIFTMSKSLSNMPLKPCEVRIKIEDTNKKKYESKVIIQIVN
ncbi:MAG: PKD domain-containing protein [bacterium]